MPAPRTTEIGKLITDYKAADKDMTEANMEAAFVARLFAILGWATDEPTVWNRQVFVRGAGFADVGLQIRNKPVLVPASATANLARIAQLMADFRVQCPLQALHLSELERTLQEPDAEIDHRVYDLYGLTEEERRVVEENVK
jgi:hypothetical protein